MSASSLYQCAYCVDDACYSTPVPLACSRGNVFGVLAGKLGEDVGFDTAVENCTQKVESVASRCNITGTKLIHRRGTYRALWAGASRGGGQVVSVCS